MKISVLVPYHPSDAQRVRVWDYIAKQWSVLLDAGVLYEVRVGADPLVGRCHDHPEFEVPPCHHRAPFSVSRALNEAASRATGDAFLLFGADHIPDASVIRHAREQLDRGFHWSPLYRELAYASESLTEAMLTHSAHTPAADQLDWEYHDSPCPGVLAVTREAWQEVGGMDEDFEGPGFEDNDLVARLTARYAPGPASPYTLRELWHGTAHRDYGPNTRNAKLFARKHGGQ